MWLYTSHIKQIKNLSACDKRLFTGSRNIQEHLTPPIVSDM